MKSKRQFIEKLYNYILERKWQTFYDTFLNGETRGYLLKLLKQIQQIIYDEIIADDIERGEAWNKKDQ